MNEYKADRGQAHSIFRNRIDRGRFFRQLRIFIIACQQQQHAELMVELLNNIAEQKDATLVQKSWIVRIPGTTKLHRLKENMSSKRCAYSGRSAAYRRGCGPNTN